MKYLLKKDLPKVKEGTTFKVKKDEYGRIMGVELISGDTIGGLLDFINGFGIDNDFFEPIKESKVWKPKQGDRYYLILCDGYIDSFFWDNGNTDNKNYLYGNVYKTEAEAIKARDKQLAIVRCRNYLIERDIFLSDEEVMDSNKAKAIVYYDLRNRTLDTTSCFFTKYYSPFGYINSKQNADKFIKDCEKDLLLIYLP